MAKSKRPGKYTDRMSERLTPAQKAMIKDFARRTAASSAAVVRAAIDEAVPVMSALIATGALPPEPPRASRRGKKAKAKTPPARGRQPRARRDRFGRFVGQGSFGF